MAGAIASRVGRPLPRVIQPPGVSAARLSRDAAVPDRSAGGQVPARRGHAHPHAGTRDDGRGTGSPDVVLIGPPAATNLFERHPAVGGIFAWEAQHALTDDVACHLGGASSEGGGLPREIALTEPH